MLKAKGTVDGTPTLWLGLSMGNLREFMQKPLDTFIKVDGKALGLSHDLVIFSGESEEQMAKALTPIFQRRTKGRA